MKLRLMKGGQADSRVAWISGALCMMVCLPGCAMLRALRLDTPTAAPVQSAVANEQLPPAEDANDKAVLAAVEGFLERTRDYDLNGPDAGAPSALRISPQPPAFQPGAPPTGGGNGTTPPAPVASRPAVPAVANHQASLESSSVGARTLALPVIESVSVAPGNRSQPLDAVALKTQTTNEPLAVQGAATLSLADQLLAQLEQQAADKEDLAGEWQLRWTALALHRDAQALEVSGHLAPETRLILSTLIRLAMAVRRASWNPQQADLEPLRQAEELRRLLADRAVPVIPAVALCRKVVTFGVYEELAESDVLAGRSSQMIVYFEIDHLASQASEDGQYETRLATRLEVLTADGRSVWIHEEPSIVDTCRRRRTDFFVAQRITLPATLPAGDYVLKVFVEDQLSGRGGEAVHPFMVISQATVANRG